MPGSHSKGSFSTRLRRRLTRGWRHRREAGGFDAAFEHPWMYAAGTLIFVPPVGVGLSLINQAQNSSAQIAAVIFYCISVVVAVKPRTSRHLGDLSTVVSALFMILCVSVSFEALSLTREAWSAPWYSLGIHGYLACLVVRKRPGWAWAILAISIALAVTYGARSDVGPLFGALMLASLVGLLVSAQVLVAEMERLFTRRREAWSLGVSARTTDEENQDAVNASIRRVQEVRRMAGGLLERIAQDNSPVTEYDIVQFRLTEAQLRDSIRGRSIANPRLLEVTRNARERGVKVDILDERGAVLPPAIMDVVTDQAIEVLDAATAGAVTIRAFPQDDPTAVFIVHDPGDDDSDAVAIEIAQHSGEISVF
ncbi:hypothetical protein [Kocuria sp.]|uniref:hypothetical protein n=1 Tax=Kocuria sp. TaxID=1871328 RepID=UPI0026E02DC1|nr:hypothetical protein [Kocuria sp.]MDO5618655.1 hypothetical protein [Kocuria sp.]